MRGHGRRHASLVDLLCDGDTALLDAPRSSNRKAYRVKWLAGGWVITLPEQWQGPAGSRPVEDEAAEIENQRYLETHLGWLR